MHICYDLTVIDELSIIIPALNEAEYLPPLLDSISRQTYMGKLQVIVVDGRSKDQTVQRAESFTDRIPDLLVLTSKKDIGHQRNVGAQHAKYKYLLFLDADVLLPPKMLERISSKVHFEDPFVVGVMHRFQGMDFLDYVFFVAGCIFLAYLLLAKMPVTNGDFMLTTRKNYDRIDGFKEGSVLGEDIDFGDCSIKSGAHYHFYLRPMIIASLRRVHKMGRLRLLLSWGPAFMRIVKRGPIYAGQGFDDYPYGHYGPTDESTSRSA